MSASLTFIVHHGQLGTKDDLDESLGLKEGEKLVVVASNDQDIVLRRQHSETSSKHGAFREAISAWEALQGTVPDLRTPEWLSAAEEKKRLAAERRELVYADPNSSATDLKSAERDWENANDELSFGPFIQQ